MKSLILMGFAVCVVPTTWTDNPLRCEPKDCGGEELDLLCRIVEGCYENGEQCDIEKHCMPKFLESYKSQGCMSGVPLWLWIYQNSTDYVQRRCWEDNPCPSSFYCTCGLPHASTICCPANKAITKEGACPAPMQYGKDHCVDSCLSDADCPGWQKCCKKSTYCNTNVCRDAVTIA